MPDSPHPDIPRYRRFYTRENKIPFPLFFSIKFLVFTFYFCYTFPIKLYLFVLYTASEKDG